MCVFCAMKDLKTHTATNPSPGWLFSVVYDGFLVRRLVFLLLLSFLIQPVHRAYAEQSPPEVSEPAAVIEAVSVDIPVPPVEGGVEIGEELVMSEVEEVAGESVSTGESISVPAETSSTTTSETVLADEVASATVAMAETGDQNEPEASSTSAAAPPRSVLDLVTDEPVPTSMIEGFFATETASSAEDHEPLLPLVSESFSDSEVRFKKEDCIQVDDGSYYCQPGAEGVVTRDAVIAARDADGDLEIYLVKDGEYIQITHNIVDDSAPYYDSRSKTMVWHQLVNDRYHIWSFDFETGASEQVTDGSFNDMEPVRYDDVTVWQRWVDDVWQIMVQRGGEVRQLTEGSSHHLSPSIYDGLVLWRTVQGSGIKVLESYDLKTGDHTVIDDPEEAAMVNPRMVMLYEAVYDNGDRVTRGVDVSTGKIIALGTLPTELPDTIPDTDATGEVGALIQVKPTAKEGTEVEQGEPVPVLDPPSPPDPFTLVIGTTTVTDSIGSSTEPVITPPQATEPITPAVTTGFDLVIPAATSTQLVAE